MAATHSSEFDEPFYLAADQFFPAQRSVALTYDDVTLATLYSEILPRDTQLATRLPLRQLVTIAPPVQRFDFGTLAVPQCPWLVLQGDQDELVDHEAVLAWTRTLQPAPSVAILPGAEHFFHGRLNDLRSALQANLLP